MRTLHLAAVLTVAALLGCGRGPESLSPTAPIAQGLASSQSQGIRAIGSETPRFYDQFRSGYVTVSRSTGIVGRLGLVRLDPFRVYLTSNGQPDHCSVYFCVGAQDPTNPCDSRWCLPPSGWIPDGILMIVVDIVLGRVRPERIECAGLA